MRKRKKEEEKNKNKEKKNINKKKKKKKKKKLKEIKKQSGKQRRGVREKDMETKGDQRKKM